MFRVIFNSFSISFIKGDIGEILFQENINVIDDPLIKKGLGSRNFDSEGVNCKKGRCVGYFTTISL